MNDGAKQKAFYAFFFLQSIFTKVKDMFLIVSSSTTRVGCLPREGMYIRAHLQD